tara:strand:- start:226 stop:903 length:678 start_codon:yes stop_codon:yes gene_type:complete
MSYGKSPNKTSRQINKVSSSLRRLTKTTADRAPNQNETLAQLQRSRKSVAKNRPIKISGGVLFFPFDVLFHANTVNLKLGLSNASNTVNGIVPKNQSNPFVIRYEPSGDSFNLALDFELLNNHKLTDLKIGGMSAQEGPDSNKINNRFSGLLSSNSGGTTNVTLSNNIEGNSAGGAGHSSNSFKIVPATTSIANAKYVLNITLDNFVLSANQKYTSFGLSATTAA